MKRRSEDPSRPRRWRLGARERLLLFWAVVACLLLLTGKSSSGQKAASAASAASSGVTFTVGTYLDVRFLRQGTQTWTVSSARNISVQQAYLAKGNRAHVVRGTLQVLGGAGTWSFDLNPGQAGDQNTVSRPAGAYTGLATVRCTQKSGKVDAKARLTLSISTQ